MIPGTGIQTKRLLLRGWRETDLAPFASMNADPEVMEHFTAPLTRQQSDTMVGRIEENFDRHGFGLWAVEVLATGEFVGFTGLQPVTFEARFTPAVEVGWRLTRAAWGHGYATEAARAATAFGFDIAGLREIVSFTSETNVRSQRVMQRLGMTHDPADDFGHPRIPLGHPLRPHVLYRLRVVSA